MFDDGVEVLPIGVPLVQTLLGVAPELFVLILQVGFGLLGLLELVPQLFLPQTLLLIHLSLQLFSVFMSYVLSEMLIALLLFLQSRKLLIPSFFEFLIFLLLFFLLSFFLFHLIFQGVLILPFKNLFLLCFFPFNLCLFFL